MGSKSVLALSRLWNTNEFLKAMMLQAKGHMPYTNVTCRIHTMTLYCLHLSEGASEASLGAS